MAKEVVRPIRRDARRMTTFSSSMIEIAVRGADAAATCARLDSAIARIPFRELPMVDRPYL